MEKTEVVQTPVKELNKGLVDVPAPDLNPAEPTKVASKPHKPRPGKRERAKKQAAGVASSATAAQDPTSLINTEPKAVLQTSATKSTKTTVSKKPSKKPVIPKAKSSTSATESKASIATSKPSAPTSNSVPPKPTSSGKPSEKPSASGSEPKALIASSKTFLPAPKTAASKPKSSTTPNWKTSWMTRDAGALADTISCASLAPSKTHVSSEASFQTLCSYNWQNDGSIFVPGGPPKWSPPTLPISLPQDSGHQFVDQNAYRVPIYPFEPAFQAMAIMNPGIKLDDVDIIVNRNSLRKLLDFAAGKRLDPFCMGLHMVNDTLFISRKEMSPRQMIRGAPNAGYGHAFEKAFTQAEEGSGNSSSHHRIIRYKIGTLDCVVRFEVDAYYEDPDAPDISQDPTDDITSAMEKLAVEEPSAIESATKNIKKSRNGVEPTKAIRAGTPISPSSLAEMKAKKTPRVHEAMPQLWFGRTQYLIAGNHEKGVVHSVSIVHVGKSFAAWETENQVKLGKMVELIEGLKRVAKGLKDGRGVLVYAEKGGDLRIYHGKGMGGVLPEYMLGKYWNARV